MSANGYFQLALYLGVLLALAKPLGTYMARIYEGQPAVLNTVGGTVREADLSHRAVSIPRRRCAGRSTRWPCWRSTCSADWWSMACSGCKLSAAQSAGLPGGLGGLVVQHRHELHHQYQLAGLRRREHHELSHADGRADGAELRVRRHRHGGAAPADPRASPARRSTPSGNFWVDLTRTTLYILLPLSLILALVLVSQGVVQTFSAYHTVPLVESVEYDNPKLDAAGQPIKDDKGNPVTEKATQKEQVIAVGPAASQIAIKQLGTNGGGFFNVNSAHPFENPTPLSNFLEVLAILLISAALCYMFGKMVGDTRQGWAILAAMTAVFVVLLAVCVGAEEAGNPALDHVGRRSDAERAAVGRQHGRQGDALRHRELRTVGNGNDRRIQRLGECHARLVHADRRPGADVADATGRGHLRRRRLGAVRNADLRHRRGVRRRPHDRPHAGVSRQEDRGVRDEDGRDRGADPSGDGARRYRPRRHRWMPAKPASPIRAHMDSPRSSTPSPRAATTTAAPSPAYPPTRPSTTRPWASACCSRDTGLPSRCWRLPVHWSRRKRCPRASVRCRRTHRCSWRCWSERSSSSARLPSSRHLPWVRS